MFLRIHETRSCICSSATAEAMPHISIKARHLLAHSRRVLAICGHVWPCEMAQGAE